MKDTGADPINNGKLFRMYPSGDIVNFEERQKRLNRDKITAINTSGLIFGRTSNEIAAMQGRPGTDLK